MNGFALCVDWLTCSCGWLCAWVSGWVYDSVSGLVDEWAGDVVYMVTGVCTVCVCVCLCGCVCVSTLSY